MPAYTPILNLYKPGGGSTGAILPDEPVDIDKINSNFDLLDAAAGIQRITTATRPSTPFKGMTVYNSTTDQIEQYNGSSWTSILPTYLAKSTITGYGTSITNNSNSITTNSNSISSLNTTVGGHTTSINALQAYSTGTGSAVSGWTVNRCACYKYGRLVHVDFSFQRTGGAITTGSTGNITNLQMGTIPAAFKPIAQYAAMGPGPGGPTASTFIDSAGAVWLAAFYPNYTIPNNSEVSGAASFLSAS